GQYNLAVEDDLFGGQQSTYGGPTVSAASLALRRQFGAHIDVFGDFSWLSNEGNTVGSGNLTTTATLPADAPNNPFTTPITVSFPAVGLSNQTDNDSETLRGVAGAIWRLPRNWTLSAEYTWSRSRTARVTTSPITGDPDGAQGPAVSDAVAIGNGT